VRFLYYYSQRKFVYRAWTSSIVHTCTGQVKGDVERQELNCIGFVVMTSFTTKPCLSEID
jgi:hypothetical protein